MGAVSKDRRELKIDLPSSRRSVIHVQLHVRL